MKPFKFMAALRVSNYAQKYLKNSTDENWALYQGSIKRLEELYPQSNIEEFTEVDMAAILQPEDYYNILVKAQNQKCG